MERNSFYEREVHPLKQAAFFIGATLVVLGVIKILQLSGFVAQESTLSWEVSLMIILIFGVFNSVMGLPYKNQNDYWFYSTLAYIAVAVFGALLSFLFCNLGIDELGPFKWIYIVFTIAYLIFLSIIRAMRKIVQIAQKQDTRMMGED